ncbi:MAG: hypothetical protein FWF50_03795 [Defluviitaleaceae bacterium]|nr:hypothetical protein [Defluviitaleaceae bacterium]
MLFKLLKHDFNYSKIQFFTMILALLLSTVLLRIWLEVGGNAEFIGVIGIILILLIQLIGTVTSFASIIVIIQNFSKGLFSDHGYLTLTLPVSRSKIVWSKVLISMFWFNLMMLTSALMAWIITVGQLDDVDIVYFLELFQVSVFEIISIAVLNANSMIFLGISILFSIITLSRCSILGRKIHALFAWILGFIFTIFLIWFLVWLDGLWSYRIYFNFGMFLNISLLAYQIIIAFLIISSIIWLVNKKVELR